MARIRVGWCYWLKAGSHVSLTLTVVFPPTPDPSIEVTNTSKLITKERHAVATEQSINTPRVVGRCKAAYTVNTAPIPSPCPLVPPRVALRLDCICWSHLGDHLGDHRGGQVARLLVGMVRQLGLRTVEVHWYPCCCGGLMTG